MRVCDITRTDEVVATATFLVVPLDAPNDDEGPTFQLDLGKAAHEALLAQDWSALAALVPAGLRKKDEKRSAGAKRAAVTRKANRQAAAGPQASVAAGGGNGGPAPVESPTDAPGLSGGQQNEGDDPDSWLKD